MALEGAFSTYQAALLLGVSLILHIGWLAISRLLLSQIASVPGPRLAALTSWYQCYYDVFCRIGGGYFPFKLKELHQQYGPIIRPNPTELHIDDPEFLDKIYAIRDRNSPTLESLMVTNSMGATEDFALHQLRRSALNPYFSLRTVLGLETHLREKTTQLGDILAVNAGTNNTLNFSDVSFACANDLVRAYSFGFDNNLMNDLAQANRERNNLIRLLMGTRFRDHFDWVTGLAQLLPLTSKLTPPAVKDLFRFRADITKAIKDVRSGKSNDLKFGSSIFNEMRDTPLLPPHEKSEERLRDDATLIVMAGTESTSKALIIATFYLLHKPSVLGRLRDELKEARSASPKGNIPLQALIGLPYLNAVIEEVHRLSFGVTGFRKRYSPTQTLVYTASYGPYKGEVYTIPPRTRMSTVTFCTHTNEELFPDPWAFDPERFITHSEAEEDVVNKRKRSMHALGKGHRKCIGMHLAHVALCLSIEQVVKYDMDLVDTVEEDVRFIYDQQISLPRLGSKGVQVVVKGEHAYA